MAATIYTEEMAQTAWYAKVAGVFTPMPDEAVAKMKALIAADQAVSFISTIRNRIRDIMRECGLIIRQIYGG